MNDDVSLRIIAWGMLLVAGLNLLDAYLTVVAVHFWGFSEMNSLIASLVVGHPWLFLLLKVFLSACLWYAARLNVRNWDDYRKSKGMVFATVFMVFFGSGAYIFYSAWNIIQLIR